MTAVFLDTAVLVYAAGADHRLRAPSQHIVRRVVSRELEAVISAGVVQEVLHRFVAIGRAETGARIARDALDLFEPVLPITHAVMRRMPEQWSGTRCSARATWFTWRRASRRASP